MREKERESAVTPGFGPRMDRRSFLKTFGLVLGLGALAACKENTATLSVPRPSQPLLPTSEQYEDVPPTPTAPPDASKLQYFTPFEARALDALAARMLPGSPSDPGAREAGVVTYIDNKMMFHDGFATPTYMHPPFKTSVQNVAKPAKGEAMDRYGYQSPLTPRMAYRAALADLDRYTQASYGKGFADLTESQQDEVLGKLEGGKIASMKDPSAKKFFDMLRQDVIEGMFCDPVYGGNRNLIGWKLVGYPGAQRGYTPRDLRTENAFARRKPQSIADLPHFHPGQPANRDVTIPVSGFTMQNRP